MHAALIALPLALALAAPLPPPPEATAAATAAAVAPAEPPPASADGPAPPELPLAAALDELDRQGPSLLAARARADEASALAREALAGLLPAVSASGDWVVNSDPLVLDLGQLLRLPAGAPAPAPIYIQPLHQLSGTVAVRVPLLVPRTWFDLAAAREASAGAAEQSAAARLSARAALASSAHLALALEEVVVAAERARADAAQLADSADRKVRAGTAPPLDALRARTELVKRLSDLVQARADLAQARLALGVLLGRPGPVRIVPPPGAGDPPPPAPADEALDRRPELRARADDLAGAEAGRRAAWARLLPELSANLAAFAANIPYPTGKYEGWRFTLDLTWPLYDGGYRYGKRREAEARVAEASAAATQQRLAVAQEARDAAREVTTAAERLRLAEEQRRLADDSAASARRSYEAGILSSLDVVDANDRLFAADVGLARARAERAAAGIALDHALGRGP